VKYKFECDSSIEIENMDLEEIQKEKKYMSQIVEGN
jgi:hypothetical protein